jgi:ubiquinone/menaquinone biosynthesis C-methylase UbiE
LQKNGHHLEDFNAILDFGCGCGRVLRHWKSVKGPQFYGTDYNPELIDWCQKKLIGLADFKVNKLTPPLAYPDEKFEFIYAISIFTHLTGDLQSTWMQELFRVLKKGGLLLITLHGESRLYQMTPEEQQQFNAGQLVVRCIEVAGTNYCGAYHPESFVRNHLSGDFEVLDFVPEGARDADQDVYLLRKPS